MILQDQQENANKALRTSEARTLELEEAIQRMQVRHFFSQLVIIALD